MFIEIITSQPFVALAVFIITWILKTYLDNALIKQLVKAFIAVAEENFETSEDDHHVLIFIDKVISKLHASNLNTKKLEQELLDEKAIKNKWNDFVDRVDQEQKTAQELLGIERPDFKIRK